MASPPEDIDIVDLREQAEVILGVLRNEEPARPFFVEFSGTPKSGKSTCIDIVSHFFRRLDFRVLAPTEGASRRTPRYLRDNLFAFNVWSASYALTHVLEGLSSPEKYHIAILDRGLFDALAWFQLLANRCEITLEECKKVQEFLLIDNWRSVIDTVFLFKTDSQTSLERENQDKLINDLGRAMNPNFLEELNRAYDTVKESYSDQFKSLNVIDTSASESTTPKTTALSVTQIIVELMSGKSDK